MTARTRTKPRSGRAPQTRRRKSSIPFSKFLRPEIIGIAVGALAIAAVLVAIDVGGVVSGTRDWLLSRFAVGLIVIFLWAVAATVAISQRAYEDEGRFLRRTAGLLAIGLFFWGAMALNLSLIHI